MQTPLLDKVPDPALTRGMSIAELKQLAQELRAETIDAVSVTGGHLGAGLGVVELTVALHHVFETPKDILIWDVGHQAYPHKILTGRRDRIRTLRQGGGLSGFTKRAESERWKSFTYEELLKRDKVNLDLFWLKDDSLEDSANLPDPGVLALEITEDLEAALAQFATIAEDLKR